ncbi:hypothetical protein ROHU_016037 [Labeo rohita]|uniref:DUF4806 domain-containing protein n=1 Tax=Labeo rohita TaxID=84645 RepID=A0A498NLP2_LABRO|nr:hypothetical protein ROHU_016037 [Labeo rohita]
MKFHVEHIKEHKKHRGNIPMRNILKVLMEIKTELKEQRAILQKLQGAPVPVPNDFECSLSLPLESLDNFDALERLLEDEAEKNRLVCHLSLLGGHKLEDTVRRMLSHIFTNKLASVFNWAGRGQKRSFETSNLQKIMFWFLGSPVEDIRTSDVGLDRWMAKMTTCMDG